MLLAVYAGSAQATSEPAIRADLEGRPIPAVEVGRYACHDLDFPLIHCYRSPEALDEALAARLAGQAGAPTLALAAYVKVFPDWNLQGNPAVLAEYGDAVTIEQDGGAEFRSCTSRLNCTNPFTGGMSIRPSGYSSGYTFCTAAMYGRYQTGVISIITAGHCLKPFSLSTTWFNGANTIGPGLGWAMGPAGDFAAIRVTASDSGSRNRVMRSGPTDWVNIAYEKPASQQTIGTTVCRSSAVAPEWNCNPINGVNMTRPVCDANGQNCVNVSHLWSASFTSALGSSGGPFLYGSTIFGILSAGDITSTYYTPTEYMTFVEPCLTSSC